MLKRFSGLIFYIKQNKAKLDTYHEMRESSIIPTLLGLHSLLLIPHNLTDIFSLVKNKMKSNPIITFLTVILNPSPASEAV